MKIVIAGVGYVGLVTGLGLAKLDNKIQFLDIDSNKIKSINGVYKSIKADTICIHSDTDNSIEILKEINKAFKNK